MYVNFFVSQTGKKKKKTVKSKQQDTVNRLFQSNKPKIIATIPVTKQKTEPSLRPKNSDTTIRLSSLTDVLQAHCKPITLMKYEVKENKIDLR